MAHTILVPLDGSPLAERALPFAAQLASAADGELVLAHVRPAPLPNAAETAPPYDLDEIVQGLRRDGVTVTGRILHAPFVGVAEALEAAACELPADLVVMSTHGRGGLHRTIFGSVADALMRQATRPVLLIPPGCKQSWAAEHPALVMVPLDGSHLAELALGPAAELAARFDAELLLVRVLSPVLHTRYRDGKLVLASAGFDEVEDAWTYLSERADQLRAAGRRVSVWVLVGSAAAAIADAARTEHADAIVMTTHGRHGVTRMLLGSTADGILQRTGVPVVLVPASVASTTAPPEREGAADGQRELVGSAR